MQTQFKPAIAAKAWIALQKTGHVGAIHRVAEYDRAVHLLGQLLDVTRDKPKHPLRGLLEVVALHIADYDEREVPMPKSTPAGVLRLLMDSNDLTQADLAPELGGQSVVSAVLRGRRKINSKQARALGERFSVSPAAFVE